MNRAKLIPPELLRYENEMDDFYQQKDEAAREQEFVDTLNRMPRRRVSWAGVIAVLMVAALFWWFRFEILGEVDF